VFQKLKPWSNSWILACWLTGLIMISLAGCGTSISAGDFSQTLIGVLAQLNPNQVTIRIINQTSDDIELDVLVDGNLQLLECVGDRGICDFPLQICPQTVEAVEERRFNSEDQFAGGRIFNQNAYFTFTQDGQNGTQRFDCGDVIIFQFSDNDAVATAM